MVRVHQLLPVEIDDVSSVITEVETLLDLESPYTQVYEAHAGLSQGWASTLLGLGVPTDLPLAYDRVTGAVTDRLGELGAEPEGSSRESFHFVLNDTLLKDNRIPPWGMDAAEAAARNIVPVPADRYPVDAGAYQHWDDVTLNPPAGADHATIELLYQPTSWEYVQFLHLANTRSNEFLEDQGENLLVAWHQTGMAAPYVMATTTWQGTVAACEDGLDNDGDGPVDYPADPGCSAAVDDSENEASLPCDDRVDGDGDGLTDFPRDPGCASPRGREDPQCDNGLDDDGDGLIDFPDDPQCTQPWRNREAPTSQCGVGPELALLLAGLGAVRLLRRQRRTRGGA